jgi:Family of unknown function (DUF6789)
MNASNVWKGMVAGFVATVVLSLLMIMKSMMGVMPDLNVIAMLAKMMRAASPAAGWVAHFVIGTVILGGLFAWFDAHLPGGSHWLKGVVFAVGAWLMMMIVIMPVAGTGLFGANLGIMAPAMTLVLHIIFGAVLGGVYGAERPEAAHRLQHAAR